MLFYIIFSMLNAKVSCEHKSILGRSDVVVSTAKDVFVMELKVDGTVDEALARIVNKEYAVQWSADSRRVIKCGVVISSEKRNIAHWKIIDGNGQLLENQKF